MQQSPVLFCDSSQQSYQRIAASVCFVAAHDRNLGRVFVARMASGVKALAGMLLIAGALSGCANEPGSDNGDPGPRPLASGQTCQSVRADESLTGIKILMLSAKGRDTDVTAGGGSFVNRDVVVDGNLVTVRGWPDNGPWMREFVKLMRARQAPG
mgnify:CR=1 FL=1